MEQTAVYYGRRVQEGVHARAQAEAEDGRHRNLPTGRPWEPIDGSDALGHVGAVVPRRFRACASPPKLMDLNFLHSLRFASLHLLDSGEVETLSPRSRSLFPAFVGPRRSRDSVRYNSQPLLLLPAFIIAPWSNADLVSQAWAHFRESTKKRKWKRESCLSIGIMHLGPRGQFLEHAPAEAKASIARYSNYLFSLHPTSIPRPSNRREANPYSMLRVFSKPELDRSFQPRCLLGLGQQPLRHRSTPLTQLDLCPVLRISPKCPQRLN